MLKKKCDVIVIGGGAAGMAAALELSRNNNKVVIIEREETLGGILLQCIHNGFGLHEFKEELTGPEYAQRNKNSVLKDKNISVYLDTTAIEYRKEDKFKVVYCYSKKYGVIECKGKAVVLSMGCRERNRGNIGIAGTRPAGIFTAGLAQRLINIDGFIPGKKVVIVGSGDIGLIMARRLTWVGAEVLGVIEILPFPSGLTRNIVQCLNDYNIPLYLNHIISKIHGKDRVEKVEIAKLTNGRPDSKKGFEIECDTLLFSVGLIPDTEFIKESNININYDTNGPVVDANLMTSEDGIFACGNVLHVHDIVDFVSEESKRCGKYVSEYIKDQKLKRDQYKVVPGSNIKYILPNKYIFQKDTKFYLRSMIVKNKAELLVKINNEIIKTMKLPHVQPSEMISVELFKKDFLKLIKDKDNICQVSIT